MSENLIAQRRFGRTGFDIPVVTFGGGWVGGLLIHQDREIANAALDKAWANGVDWIDTAASYGNGVSETVIGAWLKERPAEARPRISSKFNIDLKERDFPGQIRRSLEASLERLGLDKVQLFILHNRIVSDDEINRGERDLTVSEVVGDGGITQTLDALRREGLIEASGMTALGTPSAVNTVVESGAIDVAQVYYNLLNPSAVRPVAPGWNTADFQGLAEKCATQDMGTMGIRIFAAGHLATDVRHGREIPITPNAEDAAEEARAAKIKTALEVPGCTRAQIALRFGLACDQLSTIVVGLGEPSHFDEVLAAARMGPLPDAAVNQLEPLWDTDPAFVG